MHFILTPRFFELLALAIHVSSYAFIAAAIYWSNWWLLIPAAPVLVVQLFSLIPLRRGPMG
jgi:hypothetical protein